MEPIQIKPYEPMPGEFFHVRYKHRLSDRSYSDSTFRAVANDGYAVVCDQVDEGGLTPYIIRRHVFILDEWMFRQASETLLVAIGLAQSGHTADAAES